MPRTTLRCITIILFLSSLPAMVLAQDTRAKLQEEAAQNHETAARNHETAAQIASEILGRDPSAAEKVVLAAQKAQQSADKAQEAANKAQEAANLSGSTDDQTSAIRAQRSANRAQEAANRAQETSNRVGRASFSSSDDGSRSIPNDARPPARTADNDLPTASAASSTTLANTSTPTGMAPLENSRTSSVVAQPATPMANALVALAPAATGAAVPPVMDFNEFLNSRFDALVKARLGPKNNTNQNETPSISANSTSLVDKSSVGDLISIALTPAGTTSNTGSATSSSVTVSAYAFKAFASGRDPLDPAFYAANRNWRKVSFTYGYDYTKGKEGDPQEKGSIYGFKILPYDKRDVTNPSNATDIRTISDLLSNAGPAAASAVAKVKRALFNALVDKNKLPAAIAAKPEAERFDEFRASLAENTVVQDLATALGGEAQLIKLVDDIIAKSIDPEVKFTQAEQEAFDRIQSRPQIALMFLTKQRKGTRPNEYSGGATMDLGVLNRWNLTFNGAFNLVDNKLTKNSNGGSFGTELQIPLNIVDSINDQVPWKFAAGASGKWLTGQGPQYQAQLKLTIPFPRMPGLELPLSVSFANKRELLVGKESKIQGRMGFTFDLAKLLTAFKNQLATP